jgi:predicted dehydrogenase
VLLDGPHSVPAVEEAVRTGPYGRCAWQCDNDVVDHQVASFTFEGGATATLTTVAYTELVCQRQIRIFGTHGEIHATCHPTGDSIRFTDFRKNNEVSVFTGFAPPEGTKLKGHGGADYFLMRSFVQAVNKNDPALILSGPQETLESHLLVFAAETARKEKRVVSLDAS